MQAKGVHMSKRADVTDQLHLFASPATTPPLLAVEAAPVAAAVDRMAQRLPPSVYLGTSSWTFPGWTGLVYQHAATERELAHYGLTAYAQHPLLRAVGLDRTYYAPLPTADFAAYGASVPEAFRFLVKAHRWCTTVYMSDPGGRTRQRYERNTHFLEPQYATEEVIRPCVEGLGSKMGPLLLQFPPQDVHAVGGPEGFAEQLHRFLDALPRGPLYAVELRNAILLTAAYAEALSAVGACHCFNVHPSMPTLPAQQRFVSTATAPALVVRWMLHRTLRYEAAGRRYHPFDRLIDADLHSRTAITRLCLEAIALRRSAFVIVNNNAEGSAPLSVGKLAEQIVAQLAASER
jgi:uncharacterized protein YecE (DUF72 family)